MVTNDSLLQFTHFYCYCVDINFTWKFYIICTVIQCLSVLITMSVSKILEKDLTHSSRFFRLVWFNSMKGTRLFGKWMRHHSSNFHYLNENPLSLKNKGTGHVHSFDISIEHCILVFFEKLYNYFPVYYKFCWYPHQIKLNLLPTCIKTRMTTFIKTKLKISDDQTNIDKYRLAANITEYIPYQN